MPGTSRDVARRRAVVTKKVAVARSARGRKGEERRREEEGNGELTTSCLAFIQFRKGCTAVSGIVCTCQGMERLTDGIEMNCGGKSGMG
jgi:hypothetical protein